MIAFIVIAYFVLFQNIRKQLKNNTLIYRATMAYVGWWFLCQSLASFDLYGCPSPGIYANILIILHIYAFVWGLRAYNKDKVAYNRVNMANSLSSAVANLSGSWLFKIVLVFAVIYTVRLFMHFSAQIALYNTLGELRSEVYDGNIYGENFPLIKGLLLNPLNYLCLLVFSYKVLEKIDIVTILTGVYVIVYASLAGGRIDYVWILTSLFLVNFCIKGNDLKRFMLPTIISVGILYILISLITAARLSGASMSFSTVIDGFDDTNSQIISYAVGPLSAFDYALSHDYVGTLGGFQYGRLTGSSIDALMFSILGKLGISISCPLNELAKLVQDNYISLSPERNWNALYTSLLYYYCDAGILGVIAFPFIFGSIFIRIAYKMIRRPNIYYFILMVFFFIKMMYSVMSYGFITFFELLFVLLLFYLGKYKFEK